MATTLTPQSVSLEAPKQQSAEVNPVVRVFNRIFTRHLLNAAILMVVPLVFAQPLRQAIELLRDADLWWHLADARNLLATLHFVQVEPYSFSVAGQRWVNPEWLSEVPYWLGFRFFHFTGIYLVTWLGLAANVLFVYWRGYLKSGHMAAAFWAAALGFELMTVNSGPRTIIIAYLALSAELAILEALERGNRRLLWLMPPLFCVWINLHGSWMIGLGLLVLYIASGLFTFQKGIFDQAARSFEENKRLAGVCFASIVALFVNPYGWQLVYNPVDMILNQKLNIANAEEWQPLNLGWFVGKCALLAIVLRILSNCIRGRKWKLYEIVFIIFAWFSAFDHARFAFLAAVITTPFLAADMQRAFCAHSNVKKTIPFFNALLVGEAVWMIFHIVPSERELQKDYDQLFPHQTLAMIQPNWHTFNGADLGGIMAFESKPSYIDSRLDTFEHHGVLAAYLETIRLQDSFENLDKWHIDHILFPAHTPFIYLLEHSGGWREVKHEGEGRESYVLLERANSAKNAGPARSFSAEQ